jgi:hypothetical protein
MVITDQANQGCAASIDNRYFWWFAFHSEYGMP